MTFAELKDKWMYRVADTVSIINRNGEEYNLYEVPYEDLLNAYVAGARLHEGRLEVMVDLDYSLMFKVENGKTLYISGFDEQLDPLHTEDENKAFKFYSLKEAEAMQYYDYGYGIDTRVAKTA